MLNDKQNTTYKRYAKFYAHLDEPQQPIVEEQVVEKQKVSQIKLRDLFAQVDTRQCSNTL